MKMRRLHKSLAVLAVAGLVAAACGGDDDSSETTSAPAPETTAAETPDTTQAPVQAEGDVDTSIVEDTTVVENKYGGSVTIGLEAEATGLRPWEDALSSPAYAIMRAIYDPLIEQDVEGKYQPFLAESISPNEDFTVWTMTLRPGVAFHNGTPLTAQTIVDMFAIQQTGSAAAGAISSSGLAGVEATGELEVTYTLNKQNSAFPAALQTAPLGFPFDPAAAAADPDGYSIAPIGTGPFTIKSRDLDNETVVERNPSYWGVDPDGNQLPFLDSISFRPIPDEGSRLDALLSGTVTAMQTLRQGTIRDARAARDGGADIELLEFQGNNLGGGHYNMAVAPYDDLRVRMGLVLLNSQENVIEALGGTGISLPGTQFFSPDSPWWSAKVAEAWPKFDFEAGKAKLQEYIDDPARSDGKAVGAKIDVALSCPPDPTLIAAMQVVEQTLTATELVNVAMTNFDQATHINIALGADNGFIGTHGAHCWRWSGEGDPSVAINPFLAPYSAENAEAAGLPGVVSPLNFANYWDPESFQAANDATKTDVFEDRYALYEFIMMRIVENVPIWYSGHTATAIGIQPNIKGLNGWHVPSGDLGIGFPSAEPRWIEAYIAD
ncbi:MAG TPA: ABC transporter substrate-binding protein [Ilumatobacter sp.]